MKPSTPIICTLLVCITALVAIYFTGHYKYVEVENTAGSSLPVKIDRITGKTSVYILGTGWRTIEEEEVSQ